MNDHLFNSEWSDGLNSDCNVQHLICDQVTVLCTLDPGQLNQDWNVPLEVGDVLKK